MKINEIFNSIDGEVNSYGQGCFTTFIRLQGCNLNCSYCDTKKAQSLEGGFEKTPVELVEMIGNRGYKKVTITGGEPLLQKKELVELLGMLSENVAVTIETNGSIIPPYIREAGLVMDYKLPSSGMNDKMKKAAFKNLASFDFVKLVVKNETDFVKAVKFINENWAYGNLDTPHFAFSPMYGELDPLILKQWIDDSPLPEKFLVSLNIQLHKILYMP